MTTNLLKAADDARRFLKGFKAFAEVADALEAAGQAEQRTAEAETLLADLQGKLEAARTGITKAEREAADKLAEAAEQAAKRVADAEMKAQALLADAQAKAASVERAAKAVSDNAAAAMNRAAKGVADAQAQRDALLAEVEALEARLAEAKGQVAKLLG